MCIACSTMKSEFITLDLATKEAEWLRNCEIPLWSRHAMLMATHCDNTAAITKAKNNVHNGK